MRKLFYLAAFSGCLSICNTQLIAQDSIEKATLFQSGSLNKENLGFFVAPSYGITQKDGSAASLMSLRGGLNFSDKLTIGGFYNLSLNEIRPQSETIPNIYMDYWAVGGLLEYTLFADKLVHLTFPVYIGYGEVQMDDYEGEAGLGEANFFQIEPSALVEVNLHKFVRLNIGAGYRFVESMQYRNFNQSDISGLTGYVGLKIGVFK